MNHKRDRDSKSQRHAGAHVLDPDAGAAGIDGRADRSTDKERRTSN
jgi:hypothetical protein